jgi:hypothetical protein
VTRRQLLTTWVPVMLFCLAAILQPPLVPLEVFLVPMVAGLVILTVGYFDMRRDWRDLEEAVELHERWRAQRDR